MSAVGEAELSNRGGGVEPQHQVEGRGEEPPSRAERVSRGAPHREEQRWWR